MTRSDDRRLRLDTCSRLQNAPATEPAAMIASTVNHPMARLTSRDETPVRPHPSVPVRRRSPEDDLASSARRDDAVPFLAAYRYTDAGLDQARRHGSETWALQRREDAGEDVGAIPVPPKYDSKDYRDARYWRLRGKLDVPKERFISYPGCESDDDRRAPLRLGRLEPPPAGPWPSRPSTRSARQQRRLGARTA
jgi:hypothetical protein